MKSESNQSNVVIGGKYYKKQVLLADVNIPYKLSIDRKNNHLFFCINADEFSDQSFQSVVLNLNTGWASIILGIRNGFASAVDQTTGNVYLGGSDGIFKYNYGTNHIDQRNFTSGIDIFDMYYSNLLYFVDTCSQNLYYLSNNGKLCLVRHLKGNSIQHFVFDANYDLYFVSSSGLFVVPNGTQSPIFLDVNHDIRGATTDVNGSPFFIAKDGIYEIDKQSKQLSIILSLENGYGLAFDKNNNFVYSEERSVNTLIAC